MKHRWFLIENDDGGVLWHRTYTKIGMMIYLYRLFFKDDGIDDIRVHKRSKLQQDGFNEEGEWIN